MKYGGESCQPNEAFFIGNANFRKPTKSKQISLEDIKKRATWQHLPMIGDILSGGEKTLKDLWLTAKTSKKIFK